MSDWVQKNTFFWRPDRDKATSLHDNEQQVDNPHFEPVVPLPDLVDIKTEQKIKVIITYNREKKPKRWRTVRPRRTTTQDTTDEMKQKKEDEDVDEEAAEEEVYEEAVEDEVDEEAVDEEAEIHGMVITKIMSFYRCEWKPLS